MTGPSKPSIPHIPQVPPMPPPPEPPAIKLVTITVPVPAGRSVPVVCRGVEVGRMSQNQSRAMERVLAACQASHAQLASGRHVESYASVVRLLFELITMADRES